MKRFLLALILLLGSTALAQAQSTTLSGTVTDTPDGQNWNNGTFTFSFVPNPQFPTLPQYTWTGGTLNPTITGTMNGSGAYSVSVPSNSAISPQGSKWNLQICPQATASCFNLGNVTVTGATQTQNAAPPSIRINWQSPPATVTAYADAEVSTGASIGTTYFNLVLGSNKTCTAVSGNSCTTWAASSGGSPTPGSQISFGATVSPLAFGAKWDGKMISDAAATSGTSTYTCPNADCSFTSADLGKLVKVVFSPSSATPPCSGSGCGQVIAEGFICLVNNASSIGIGTTFPGCAVLNAAANCATASNNNCNMAWATQADDVAINAAAVAAWNNGNKCLALEWPAGIAFFSNGILNLTVPAGSPCAGYGGGGNGPGFADFSQTGPVVYGQGAGSTILVPYNFNFAGCTFGATSAACNFATQAIIASGFQITGMGDSGNGTTHNVFLTEFRGVTGPCTSTSLSNVSFNNWMVSSAGTVGLNWIGGCFVTSILNSVFENFGNTTANLGGNNLNLTNDEFFGAGGTGSGLVVGVNFASGNIISTASTFANVNSSGGGSAVIQFSGPATWNSFGDNVTPGISTSANGLVVRCAANCTMNLSGDTLTTNNASSGATSLFNCAGVTCNVRAYGTQLLGAGAASKFVTSTGTFNYFDACGNTVTNGSVASTGTFNIYGSCSVTGTNVAAGNLVLSAGWGNTPTAAWSALTGTTQQVQGTITAGTAGLAANPTITYTFPTPFPLGRAPTSCFALQTGGTQVAVANPFSPSALSATGVTFTYNGTPAASATLLVQIQCWNP